MKDDLHSYFKAREHGILHINCDMEDKLNQLKGQFCKWHCKNKNEEIIISYVCSREKPDDCNGDCGINSVSVCEYCSINEFIDYIRDEL